MTEAQGKLMKLNIKYNLLDNRREGDMEAINVLMNQLLEIYSKEIIWENLHVLDRNTDVHRLQQVVKMVRNVTTNSNQQANQLANDE